MRVRAVSSRWLCRRGEATGRRPRFFLGIRRRSPESSNERHFCWIGCHRAKKSASSGLAWLHRDRLAWIGCSGECRAGLYSQHGSHRH